MRVLLSLIIIFSMLPMALAADSATVTISGPQNLQNDTTYNFTISITADSIVSHSIDIVYDQSTLELDSYTYLDSNNNDKAGNTAYICAAPVLTAGRIDDLDCAKLGGNSDPAGDFIILTFKTIDTGLIDLTIDDAIVVNVTNVGSGGYLPVNFVDYQATSTPQGFSYGTPTIPATMGVDNIVNVSYPITFTTTGQYIVPLPSPFTGTNYWLVNGSTQVSEPIVFTDQLSLDLEVGNTYELITTVDTPTLTELNEDNGNYYNLSFTVSTSSIGAFNGIYGNVSVNNTYQHFWLYEDLGEGWSIVNVERNVIFDNDSATVSFENMTIDGTVNYNLLGNITCQNNWLIGTFGACSGGTKSRTDFDLNYCSAPYTRVVTDTCTDGGTENTGGNGPSSGSGSGPDEQEFTTITNPNADITELTVTYLAYREAEFVVTSETFDIGDGVPYAGYVIESNPEIIPEKISNVVVEFEVNEFWKENNGVTDIEIFQRIDDTWTRLSILEDETSNKAFTNSLGSFAIVGYIPESSEQIPGEIDVQTNEGEGEGETTEQTRTFNQGVGILLPIIIGILVIGAIVTGVVLHARHPAKHGHPKEVVHDKYDQLNDYVKKAKSAGLNEDKIRENLKRVGWHDDVINSVLK